MALPNMITTLLFDFANVLMFSGGVGEERYVFNTKLVEFIKEQQINYPAHVFSNLPLTILDQAKPVLIPPFVSFLSARDLGLSKTNSESYTTVAKMLGAKPEEILFCDDQLHNIEAAQQAGLQTIHFESTQQYMRKAKPLLI